MSNALLDQIGGISFWVKGEARAPHKPLLLLWALASVQRGEERLQPFSRVGEELERLLVDFGPPRKSNHPEMPFWNLQKDGDFWEIPQHQACIALRGERKRQKDVPRKVLLQADAHGGFSPAAYEALQADPALVNELTARLLHAHFPTSLHEDLLDAVAMPWVVEQRPRHKRRRDSGFRELILRIYERRCAVCGFDGRLAGSEFGLEAAHVQWHAAGGPDQEDNGLALCVLHHRALDRGVIGLTPERRVMVSQHVHGGDGVDLWLTRYTGQPLRGPQPGTAPVAARHIKWHTGEVFRGPSRAPVSGD